MTNYGTGLTQGPCIGCGHAQRNHLQGVGLCVVKSCRICLIYRPSLGPSAALFDDRDDEDVDPADVAFEAWENGR